MTLNIHPTNEEVFFNLNPAQRKEYAESIARARDNPPEVVKTQGTIEELQGKLESYVKTSKVGMLPSYDYGLEAASEPISSTTTGDVPVAVKADVGKTDWAILPLDALEEVIKVFQFGEKKYARGNYANGEGLEYSRVLNSLMRHTTSFMRGEDNDPETGLSHMAHASCCTLMLLHYITHKEQFSTNDNRAKTILK
jgi:hypothetical protein